MSTARQNLLPNIVLLGNDRSQYSVIQFLLEGCYQNAFHEEGRIVCVGYARKTEAADAEGIVWAASDRIAQGMVILCSPTLEPPEGIAVSQNAHYLIVEGEAFGTESTLKTIERLRRRTMFCSASIGVLLFKGKTKRASTDLNDIPEPEQAAKAKLTERGVPAMVLKKSELSALMIAQAFRIEDPWNRAWLRRLEELRDGLESTLAHFLEDYDFALDMGLGMEDVDGGFGKKKQLEICSFRTLERFRSGTIWESYLKALDSVLFAESNRIGFALDCYSGALEDAGWPLREDSGALRKCLHEEMYGWMRRVRKDLLAQKGKEEQYLVPRTQEEYDRQLSFGQEEEINVEFLNAVNEYLNRCVPQILSGRLHKKLEALKTACDKIRMEERMPE